MRRTEIHTVIPLLHVMEPSSFFFIWLTPPASFRSMHRRSIESICRWHPHATVRALSNTLPLSFFSALQTSCDVVVQRYDLSILVRGSIAEVWYDFRRFWNRSIYFPNHEADLLRLLVLRDRGGVYVDTDVIFVRPLKLAAGCLNAVGIESGRGGIAATAAISSPAQYRWADGQILCNAVLSFSAGAPLLRRAIETFVREYVPLTPGLPMLELVARGEWGAMGPWLLTRMVAAAPPSEGTCIMEQEAFFPISPPDAAAHFRPWHAPRDQPRWARIAASAITVHWWNALTSGLPLACGSLVHRLLEDNCVTCEPLECV